MTKKEALFVLIKSLSRNEKRYFKLFCRRETSGENYLKLFEAIDKQNIYDEKRIKEKFKKEKFVRQLHVTKNYLQKMILKSLRNFHSGLSKDAELKELLRNIEILYNKELYTHCLTELKKADAIARKYEINSGLIEVQNWQRKLQQTIHPHHYKAFQQVLTGQAEAISCLQNSNRYWQLAVGLSMAASKQKKPRSKNIKLLNDESNAKTLEAKVLHYNSAYLWHLQQRDFQKAENAMYDLLALFESQPHRMQEDSGLYASSVNNLVSYLVFRKKNTEALALIAKAKLTYEQWAITSENKTLLKQILRTYNIELELYRNTKAFNEHLGFINNTEAFIAANKHKMPKEYMLSFWFQLANIHFMRKDFDRSLQWINQLLNTKFKEGETALLIHTRMLNIMVHLEQQNLFVLRYFVDSTRRFIRKVRQLEKYEKTLLDFFAHISNAPPLEYKDKFAALYARLLPEGKESLLSAEALNYIDYKEWIEGRLK